MVCGVSLGLLIITLRETLHSSLHEVKKNYFYRLDLFPSIPSAFLQSVKCLLTVRNVIEEEKICLFCSIGMKHEIHELLIYKAVHRQFQHIVWEVA